MARLGREKVIGYPTSNLNFAWGANFPLLGGGGGTNNHLLKVSVLASVLFLAGDLVLQLRVPLLPPRGSLCIET